MPSSRCPLRRGRKEPRPRSEATERQVDLLTKVRLARHASAPDAILVLPQESARQKQCCQVAGWLDRDVLLYESRSSEGLRLLAWQQGTKNFWQVAEVTGWTMGRESVVSSYAALPSSLDG